MTARLLASPGKAASEMVPGLGPIGDSRQATGFSGVPASRSTLMTSRAGTDALRDPAPPYGSAPSLFGSAKPPTALEGTRRVATTCTPASDASSTQTQLSKTDFRPRTLSPPTIRPSGEVLNLILRRPTVKGFTQVFFGRRLIPSPNPNLITIPRRGKYVSRKSIIGKHLAAFQGTPRKPSRRPRGAKVSYESWPNSVRGSRKNFFRRRSRGNVSQRSTQIFRQGTLPD
jgi:hypothetical protein